MSPKPQKKLYSWLIYTSLILLSYAFLQPAFEGFDENAHYSRVLDASRDLGTQFVGAQPFNDGVLSYPGPEAYASGNAPFSRDRTYDNFYLKSASILESVKAYNNEPELASSIKENWQYQHPPLYYLLTGLFSRVSSFDGLVLEVIGLRIISILVTILALFYCYKGLEVLCAKKLLDSTAVFRAASVFALCFPMFYFEFARIGNDCLVFLSLSIAFYYLTKSFNSENPRSSLFGMSMALAFGLLTKAVVLPLLPVFAIYAVYCLWASTACKNWLSIFIDFIRLFFVPILLGLSWYIFMYLQFGEFGLGTEARDLASSTGLINGLYANFNVVNFLRGLIVPLASFTYAGSWSLVRAPIGVYLLLGFTYVTIVVIYIRAIFSSRDWMFNSIPIALLGSLYAGLAYHVLISMALSGLGTSGGWYIYVLSPWLLMVIAIAVSRMRRILLNIVHSIGLVVSFGLFFANALIYSGFIAKDDNKKMQMLDGPFLEVIGPAMDRLSYVSYPSIAIPLFAIGILMAVYLLLLQRRDRALS